MVAPQAYEFGAYRLDVSLRRLLRAGQAVPLTPKAFDTLLALIERRDRVVEKAELMKIVWPDSFVEEANLSQTIFVLRKTLGDDAGGRPFIDTMPRRGYRFVADVREVVPGGAIREARPASAGLRRAAWAVVAVVVVGGVLSLALFRGHATGLSPERKLMLAVVPFENLSGDAAQEYFSHGLTEEMSTQLGQLDPNRLGVIASSSVTRQTPGRTDARHLGSELGVDYLLEGSVRRDGPRVRIAARLVQVADQSQIWADDYDRELRDVLSVQADVARMIAQQIRIRLTPEQNAQLRNAKAVNPDAFENYLKGRFFWNKRTQDGYQRAIELFDQSIRLDATYAPAFAGLADAYALLGSMTNLVLPRAEAMRRAREAARAAIALDSSSADAHTSLGFVEMHYDWQFAQAEGEFQNAIALNPAYPTAHHWYAYDLIALGRLDDAIVEVRRAQKADPLSVIINRDICEMLMFAGRYDEAFAQCQKTLEMDPSFELTQYTLAWLNYRKGNRAAFLEGVRRTMHPSGLSMADVFDAPRSVGLQWLAEFEHRNPQPYGSCNDSAVAAAYLGEIDHAFASLDRCVQERVGGLIVMSVTPEYDPIRHDPRFAALMHRVGVVPPAGH